MTKINPQMNIANKTEKNVCKETEDANVSTDLHQNEIKCIQEFIWNRRQREAKQNIVYSPYTMHSGEVGWSERKVLQWASKSLL